MEASRVLFGLEVQPAGEQGTTDRHRLDPGQAPRADQASGHRVETADVLVAEPDLGPLSVVGGFQEFGPTEVGQGQRQVEGGVGQQRRHRPGGRLEGVLGVEPHRRPRLLPIQGGRQDGHLGQGPQGVVQMGAAVLTPEPVEDLPAESRNGVPTSHWALGAAKGHST